MPLPGKRQWMQMSLMALLMFVFANAFSTWGLRYIPTGLGSLIGALYPLCVMIIEWVFYKKRTLSPLTFLGMLLGLAGVVFVFYNNMFATFDARLIFGLAVSLFAILAWSFGSVILARHPIDINPYYGMGWQMIIGSGMLWIICLSTKNYIPLSAISIHAWLEVCYLFIVGSIVTFIAFIFTLSTLPPEVSSLYAYVNPIVAIITASILLGEQLTSSILIGTVITLVGVYLVNHSTKHDKEKIIAEAEI